MNIVAKLIEGKADIRLEGIEMLHNGKKMIKQEIINEELVQKGNIPSEVYKTYYKAITLQNLFKKGEREIIFKYI